MTKRVGNMSGICTFSHNDAALVNHDICSCCGYTCLLGGCVAYMFLSYPNVYTFILFLVDLFLTLSTCVSLYYRWWLFKYNDSTTLEINLKQRLFTYKHDDDIVSFSSDDIKEWYWRVDDSTYPYSCVVVEIVDVRLQNGEKVIISSGIGDVLDLFCESLKADGAGPNLELPGGTPYDYAPTYIILPYDSSVFPLNPNGSRHF